MPRKHTRREYAENTWYHVYNRASNRMLFREESDYSYFKHLLERYLTRNRFYSRFGQVYPTFFGVIELAAYALMPSHFHFLILQKDTRSLYKFMHSLITNYVGYYNKKYMHEGSLFSGRFRASRVTDDTYLIQLCRYIHLNRDDWQTSDKTSLSSYLSKPELFVSTQSLKNIIIQMQHDPIHYLNDHAQFSRQNNTVFTL